MGPTRAGRLTVTTRQTLSVDEIDLSDLEFWAAPWSEREAAFKTLRSERPIAFFAEAEMPESAIPLPPGPGYYAITKYQDIVEMSRHPELFCSGSRFDHHRRHAPGVPRILRVDDQHGRPPSRPAPENRLGRLQPPDGEQRGGRASRQVADSIIEAVREEGECDFVTEVSSRLPLKVICDMMGIPESDYDTVFHASNVILSMGDTEYIPEGEDPLLALLNAGNELAMGSWRACPPTGSTTPPTTSPRSCCTPTSTGSRSPTQNWPRSSSSCWWPGTRRPATPSATDCGR
jgi:cytochrome P450